jgi:hypothetical protein
MLRAVRFRHFVCTRNNVGSKASWGKDQVGDENVDNTCRSLGKYVLKM